MELNRIYHGDCLELMTDIDSDSVDLICTDVPYVRSLAGLYDWEISFPDFAKEFNRVISSTGGQIAIFSDYPTGVAIGQAFEPYFRFRYFYVWKKSNGQPIGKMQPISNVEIVTVWCKRNTLTRNLTFNPIMRPGLPYSKKHKAGNPTRKKEKDYITNNTNGDRWPDQVLNFPSKDNLPEAERTGHPTQKSLGLCGYLIKTLSNECDLILDPFSGSGSMAIACHRLKRNFLAIEKDPVYFRESRQRLENEQCQGRLF
ncbi:hypothetical protein KJ656_05660 [bacterium]|nr:hypothetical protein [bacterium]